VCYENAAAMFREPNVRFHVQAIEKMASPAGFEPAFAP